MAFVIASLVGLPGVAKGTTIAAAATVTSAGADHNALDVILRDASGVALGTNSNKLIVDTGLTSINIGNFPATQAVSQSGTWNIGTVTTITAVTSITNPVAVTGTFWQATQPVSQSGTWNIGTVTTITNPVTVTGSVGITGSVAVTGDFGTLTNNNAAPSNDNLGVLSAVANAAAQSWTEGRQVLLSTDLSGNLRVITASTSTIAINNFPATQAVSQSGTWTVGVNNFPSVQNQGLPALKANAWPVYLTDGTTDVGITGGGLLKVDISGATGPVTGTLTNNNASPTANNVGVLVAVASAAAPTYNEGRQVLLSTDLAGNQRIIGTMTRNARQADPALPVRVINPPSSTSAFGASLVTQENVRANLSFPYAINARLAITTTSGTAAAVAWANGMASITSGTDAGGLAKIESREAVRYTPGQGVICRFTAIFNAGVANTRQEVGIGDDNDGFFFGYNGTVFGVMRRQSGVDTWATQDTWNGDDKFDGTGPSGVTLDPAKGSPYMIQYQWLGFGAIKFFIEDPTTGQFVLCHTIRYSNANTSPSIQNPTLPLHAKAISTGSTTSITLKTGSMAGIVEGVDDTIGSDVIFSAGAAVSGVSNAAALTLKSKATNVLGGTNTNRVTAHINSISVRAAANNDLYVQLVLNTTLGGSPSYADVSTATSVMQVDVAGTTVTGGIVIWAISVSGGGATVIDLTPYDIHIRPGETLTAQVIAESGNVSGRVILNWHEEQ